MDKRGKIVFIIIVVVALALVGLGTVVFQPHPISMNGINIYTFSPSGNNGYSVYVHDNSNEDPKYSQTFTSFPTYFTYPAGDTLTISTSGPSGNSFTYFIVGTEKQYNNPFNATFTSNNISVMACYKQNP